LGTTHTHPHPQNTHTHTCTSTHNSTTHNCTYTSTPTHTYIQLKYAQLHIHTHTHLHTHTLTHTHTHSHTLTHTHTTTHTHTYSHSLTHTLERASNNLRKIISCGLKQRLSSFALKIRTWIFFAAAASAVSVYFGELFSYVDGGLPIVRKWILQVCVDRCPLADFHFSIFFIYILKLTLVKEKKLFVTVIYPCTICNLNKWTVLSISLMYSCVK